MYPKGNALAGKVAIVTGAASGIGEAVSKIFTANQCKVVLVDIQGDRLDDVVEEIKNDGGICRGVQADVTDEEAVIKFFGDTVREWGKVNVLVNSAGRDSLAPPVTEVTLEEWNKTIGPNMTGSFPVLPGSIPHHGEAGFGWKNDQYGFLLRSPGFRSRSQSLSGLKTRHDGIQQKYPAGRGGEKYRRDCD